MTLYLAVLLILETSTCWAKQLLKMLAWSVNLFFLKPYLVGTFESLYLGVKLLLEMSHQGLNSSWSNSWWEKSFENLYLEGKSFRTNLSGGQASAGDYTCWANFLLRVCTWRDKSLLEILT